MREPVTVNGLFDKVVRGGPWALLCLIVLVWLGQSTGYVGSEQRTANEQMKTHAAQQQETNEKLSRIEAILRENQERAAEQQRIMCLNSAKAVEQLERCAKIR